MSIADVTSAVDALESSLASVHGDDGRTRRYPPMSLGAFADAVDELADHGWQVERISTHRVHVHDNAATYNLVADEDQTVAQLLQGKEAWSAIEAALKGHISGDIIGEAPGDGSSAETKLVWLKEQAERVADGARTFRDKVTELPKEEAAAVKKLGRAAAQTIQKNAQALKRGAEKNIRDMADAVVNTAKGAVVTAGWGAGIGIGVIAIAGLIIYASAKSGGTQRRATRYRDEFTRGARDAGVL